ncbi:MAG: recombinase family protein [Chromatiaceae bacterium]|nr:recombinase family protein [Chromatiaceae bacterium]MCF8003023.1 recombinase family protein [Chromatiaceae bacterium]
MGTKTIVYVRVSTATQVEEGVSLEAQQHKAAAYAGLYDLELIETIVDAGVSAKTLERPGLQKALGMIDAGDAKALLVVKLDRLTRSVGDLGRLIEGYFAPGKAELMSVSEQIDTRSANGRLTLNVLMSVSQWEREIIGERTSDAMRHMQAQGHYIGGRAPYGFRLVDTALVADTLEQQVITQARELRARGLSLAKVATELETRGFRSRNAKRFVAQQIKRMVV